MIWSFYSKFSTLFTVVGCGLCFLIAIYFIYIYPPDFGQEVQDKITKDHTLMQRIGGWDTAEFNFTNDKERDNTFYVKINGNCKGAFVKVNGLYNKNEYIITDSIIVSCK